jgi:hypothetical protein
VDAGQLCIIGNAAATEVGPYFNYSHPDVCFRSLLDCLRDGIVGISYSEDFCNITGES